MATDPYHMRLQGPDLVVEIGDPDGDRAPTTIRFDAERFVARLLSILEPDLAVTLDGDVYVSFDGMPERAGDAAAAPLRSRAKRLDTLINEMVEVLDCDVGADERAALSNCLARLDAARHRVACALQGERSEGAD